MKPGKAINATNATNQINQSNQTNEIDAMKVSYYPGCSLEATARDYRESLEYVCRQLGIELAEMDDWSCCGATAAHSTDEFLSLALPARNLMLAEAAGMDLVVPCPMCFNRLKTTEQALKTESPQDFPYAFEGRIKVWDLLDFLSRPEWVSPIQAKVRQSLKDLTVVCYYGCMANRPPRITEARNPENPQGMDTLLKALGAHGQGLVLQDGLLRGQPHGVPAGYRAHPGGSAL